MIFVSYQLLTGSMHVTFSVMVEAFAQEVSSERFCEALRFGFNEVSTW